MLGNLIDAQMLRHPRSRALAQTDAQFRHAFELLRDVLTVTEGAMRREGIPPFQAERVLQRVLDAMLNDEHIQAREHAVFIAEKSAADWFTGR